METKTTYLVTINCTTCGGVITGSNAVEKFAADIACLAYDVHMTTIHGGN